jgi:hypothetical protein
LGGSSVPAVVGFAGIEKVLAWAPVSIEAVLAAGEPTELTSSQGATPRQASYEDELCAIRDDPDMPQYPRCQAQAQLDAIAALIEAAREDAARRAG